MVGQGLETDDCVDTAQLWSKSVGPPDKFGATRVIAPVPICCRWRPNLVLSPNPQSNTAQSTGEIVVDRVIKLGSILKNDCEDQLYEVVGFNEKWDVFGESARRTAKIALWNSSLPEIADT